MVRHCQDLLCEVLFAQHDCLMPSFANGQKKDLNLKNITQTRPSCMSAGDNEDVGIWRTDLSQTTCNFIIITTERAGNWVIQAADCQQPTQSPQWMLATYVSAKHVDMLRLYISFRLNFFFNFTLWQCCAYDLVRFRHKKPHGNS